MTKISTVGQSGRETPAVRGAVTRESCATVNRPGRWPTPNGSRRPTRGEVHDGDAGHDAATACQLAEATDIANHTQADKSLNDESPRSIFWVSQVYP
uniref:Uncharacterized protein n=1 Tax=Trichogramma kaykai TaxID=54128 RepID=A0ABD2WKP3_9HYME